MSESSLEDIAKEHKLEQDHKRELDHKHKWALGDGPITRGQMARRPAKPANAAYYRAVRREFEFEQHTAVHNAKISRKRGTLFDIDPSASDTSAEEDVKDASTAPEPDAGITYSFDAPRGPGKGSQIFGLAIAKAVERFETKATEKLINEEYEVVAKEKEDEHGGYAADEDDFELV